MENNKEKKYPSRDECLRILHQTGCPELVIGHLKAVTELALKISSYFPEADRDLIEAGALLHDLGRARTHGIDHAVTGTKLAAELGLAEELISIIERHICAGIPRSDAKLLGLPVKDYIPLTIEERIVAHADNLFEGDKRCTITRSIKILQKKGLPAVADRVRQLHQELSRETGIDIDDI